MRCFCILKDAELFGTACDVSADGSTRTFGFLCLVVKERGSGARVPTKNPFGRLELISGAPALALLALRIVRLIGRSGVRGGDER
jgi:hypothetical protein